MWFKPSSAGQQPGLFTWLKDVAHCQTHAFNIAPPNAFSPSQSSVSWLLFIRQDTLTYNMIHLLWTQPNKPQRFTLYTPILSLLESCHGVETKSSVPCWFQFRLQTQKQHRWQRAEEVTQRLLMSQNVSPSLNALMHGFYEWIGGTHSVPALQFELLFPIRVGVD